MADVSIAAADVPESAEMNIRVNIPKRVNLGKFKQLKLNSGVFYLLDVRNWDRSNAAH